LLRSPELPLLLAQGWGSGFGAAFGGTCATPAVTRLKLIKTVMQACCIAGVMSNNG
jgi:hypothetical protein